MKSWSEADKFFSFLLILFTQKNDFLSPTIIFCLNLAIKTLQRKNFTTPKHLISGEGGLSKRGGVIFPEIYFLFKETWGRQLGFMHQRQKRKLSEISFSDRKTAISSSLLLKIKVKRVAFMIWYEWQVTYVNKAFKRTKCKE